MNQKRIIIVCIEKGIAALFWQTSSNFFTLPEPVT